MPGTKAAKPNANLRSLPSIDELLRTKTAREIAAEAGDTSTSALARVVVEEIRGKLINDTVGAHDKAEVLEMCEARLGERRSTEQRSGMRRVMNATGVVIHTNLGRAPLSDNAKAALIDASGCCSVEYDINEGKRGRRGSRVEQLLIELTGAEDAIVVNNCAAAAFLVLTAFAAGGEVVISRGEMVEIGGDFRVPDVLVQSGATLREVGTTNRTKIADYEKAIGENTRVLLRVHPSNYRIVGFTAAPSLAELVDLANRSDVLLYEDIGSGAFIDLTAAGLPDEPVVAKSIDAGVHVVTFSGDKLLGGPQSGIIAGRRDLIEKLRKHPLNRALRPDKLTLAALEATLEAFRRGRALEEIPVLKMLSQTAGQIAERAALFVSRLKEKPSGNDLTVDLVKGKSAVGGGSAAAVEIETTLIALTHHQLSSATIEKLLRESDPPVISRILGGRVVLDLRTVLQKDEEELLRILSEPPA